MTYYLTSLSATNCAHDFVNVHNSFIHVSCHSTQKRPSRTHVFEELLALFLGELGRRDVTLLVALDAAELFLEPPSLLLHLLLLSLLQ